MCADMDVRMRMRVYECNRVPTYTAFRMRNFYGVMPMTMHRGGRSGEEFYVRMSGFSCGCADAYAHLHQ